MLLKWMLLLNNGVDDIRNIIEDVQYPPQEASIRFI